MPEENREEERIAYSPINPVEAYSKNRFKNSSIEIFGMEQGLEALTKDSGSPDALKGLGNIIFHNPDIFYNGFSDASASARKAGEEALNSGQENMNAYLQNHSDKIYRELGEKEILSLIASTNPDEDSNDKGYKEFTGALEKNKEISEATKSEEKIVEYVAKELTGEAEWFQKYSASQMGNSPFIEILFQAYTIRAQKKIKKVLEKTSKANIKNYGRISMKNAEKKGDKQFFNVLGRVAFSKMSNGDANPQLAMAA